MRVGPARVIELSTILYYDLGAFQKTKIECGPLTYKIALLKYYQQSALVIPLIKFTLFYMLDNPCENIQLSYLQYGPF